MAEGEARYISMGTHLLRNRGIYTDCDYTLTRKIHINMRRIIHTMLFMAACLACTAQESTPQPRPGDSEAVERVIMSRRSIRKYTPQKIGRETLQEILRYGINAPNGQNRQAYEYDFLLLARFRLWCLIRVSHCDAVYEVISLRQPHLLYHRLACVATFHQTDGERHAA